MVVEYRWHPLYGKKLRLFRRTVHGGAAVVHVEARGTVSRELPAWMVDGSICGGMELGPPQVSIPALDELRRALDAKSKAVDQPDHPPGFVSSLVKESESREATAKDILPAVKAAGLRSGDPSGRESTRGSGQRPRRPAIRGTRDARRISGGKK